MHSLNWPLYWPYESLGLAQRRCKSLRGSLGEGDLGLRVAVPGTLHWDRRTTLSFVSSFMDGSMVPEMDSSWNMSKGHVRLLQMCLGFVSAPTSSEDFDDVVFIAIDFECLQNIKLDSGQDLSCQVGVAILNTRTFISSPQTAISAFNFVVGSPSYCLKNKRKFRFGESVTIHRNDMRQNLEALISRTRNNVLVGHDFANESNILQFLGFDLHSSIVGIIDLQRVASEMLPGVSLKLYNVLEEVDCPYGGLHNAGNDAYFTLRALLLLAIESYPSGVAANDDQRGILAALEAVTQVCIPEGRMTRSDKNREKKLKRVQRSQKYQARLRDPETEERIRVERAEKKLKREDDSIIESLSSTIILIGAADTAKKCSAICWIGMIGQFMAQ